MSIRMPSAPKHEAKNEIGNAGIIGAVHLRLYSTNESSNFNAILKT